MTYSTNMNHVDIKVVFWAAVAVSCMAKLVPALFFFLPNGKKHWVAYRFQTLIQFKATHNSEHSIKVILDLKVKYLELTEYCYETLLCQMSVLAWECWQTAINGKANLRLPSISYAKCSGCKTEKIIEILCRIREKRLTALASANRKINRTIKPKKPIQK